MIELEPIGVMHSLLKSKAQAHHQPSRLRSPAYLQFAEHFNLPQMLLEAQGFSHFWVIFQFNQSLQVKEVTHPPDHPDLTVGVWASRSPYRPNHIGLSCLEVAKLELAEKRIYFSDCDILDGSPVIDIKPYHVWADSKPQASSGWMKKNQAAPFSINIAKDLTKKFDWIFNETGWDVMQAVCAQLESQPSDFKRKRITQDKDFYVLAFRTWRVRFTITEASIELLDVYSGYSDTELREEPDPFADKAAHKKFAAVFLRRE